MVLGVEQGSTLSSFQTAKVLGQAENKEITSREEKQRVGSFLSGDELLHLFELVKSFNNLVKI